MVAVRHVGFLKFEILTNDDCGRPLFNIHYRAEHKNAEISDGDSRISAVLSIL